MSCLCTLWSCLPVEDLWTSFLHRGLARPNAVWVRPVPCQNGQSWAGWLLPSNHHLRLRWLPSIGWSRSVKSLIRSTTGGRASMVWRHVLDSVEAAHQGDQPVRGFSADIVKAFNALPRLLALTAAKLLGVDQGTLQVWAGALAGFRRHFVIQGSYNRQVSHLAMDSLKVVPRRVLLWLSWLTCSTSGFVPPMWLFVRFLAWTLGPSFSNPRSPCSRLVKRWIGLL